MREVKAVCPQCHQEYAYFEPEEYDWTSGNCYIIVKQCCPHCGYPDVIYTWHDGMEYG